VSDADDVIMRVVDGVGEAIDAKASGHFRPPTDPIQNVELLAAFESDGQTFVSYRYVRWVTSQPSTQRTGADACASPAGGRC
jgi:hypothetical protein